MILKAITRILIEKSSYMTGRSTVIILRMIIDIMKSDKKMIISTKKALSDKYCFSPPCVTMALSNASKMNILNVDSPENGCTGVKININKEFLR